MHILLAPDSFKESLSVKQVQKPERISRGLYQMQLLTSFPIGDGGEGTMGTL